MSDTDQTGEHTVIVGYTAEGASVPVDLSGRTVVVVEDECAQLFGRRAHPGKSSARALRDAARKPLPAGESTTAD